MTLFSCLFPTSEPKEANGYYLAPETMDSRLKSVAQPPRTVNASFLELLHSLALLEGGGLPSLVNACKAMCQHLSADQVSICLLATDKTATVVACAGLEGDMAVGKRQMFGGADSEVPRSPYSVADAALRRYEVCPTMPVMFQEAPPASESCGSGDLSSSHSTWHQRPVGGSGGIDGGSCRRNDLPEPWRQLAVAHNCRQFAAVAMVTAGVPVGVMSMASKSSSRPTCWSTEALTGVALLMAGHVRGSGGYQGGSLLAVADSLSALAAAATLSQVVAAVGEAAVEVSNAVARVQGQARVAFLQPDASAAAIFLQPPPGGEAPNTATGVASPLVSRGRRTSCEYIMSSPHPSSPSVGGNKRHSKIRASLDTILGRTSTLSSIYASPQAATAGHVAAVVEENRMNSSSFTDAQSMNRVAKSRLTLTIASDKGASCKGHTLPLSGTLLADALSKEATGLCVSDCASYVQDKRAFPRDAVLSRDGVMPLSLALATLSPDGKPLVALYVTYSFSLPQPLLQAVVEGLQQLLQAMLPIIKCKLEGALLPEWDYLRAELEEALRRKNTSDPNRSTNNGFVGASDAQLELPSSTVPTANGMECNPQTAAVLTARGSRANNTSSKEGTSTTGSFTFNGMDCGGAPSTANANVQQRCDGLNQASPFAGLAAPDTATTAAALGRFRQTSLCRPSRADGYQGGRPNSGLRRLLGIPAPGTVASNATISEPQAHEALVGDLAMGGSDSDSSPQVLSITSSDAKSLPGRHEMLLGAVRSVSFRLEAAKSPRGASRLAPIITIMHERLKAAQAAQMISGRTEARKADLQSVKLLQEIGKGGYGTVYRGKYHGSEVAVKVIQEKELAALNDSNQHLNLQHSASVVLHKQNLHDAIELVASVSVSHPNIVQVLAFFTDCKLQLAVETSTLFDSIDMADQPSMTGARLVHMPSLLESPSPGQELGGISVALVMEYMDAGSLSDAIQKRVFFERLEVNHPGAGGRASKGLLAVSMRSVYATLLEIALALRHMHSLHLVHCDLKPQNVLLKTAPRDPRGFTAKLSDFGLAKTMAHDEHGQLVIDEAVASGTITHIAPEVFMGKKSLGAAVDIYAFGIIMYQVLCGMRLYEGMSAQEIANAVAHRMLRPTLPSWMPANYRALAERCWHQLPSVRPTADELVRQLEKLSDFRRRNNMRPQSSYQH
ncbi:hypothetical protein VaNZ11_006253 [Volvox africanus]|uniref:Protein kinase domain-containing protein n=1 Tax=Volvox africanus TaxID=51714 RepID=A0ABQ5S0R0_9CHLO|nr:hypothetical protein VaNZ11_006253 [Volvox africanus]